MSDRALTPNEAIHSTALRAASDCQGVLIQYLWVSVIRSRSSWLACLSVSCVTSDATKTKSKNLNLKRSERRKIKGMSVNAATSS